MQKSLILANLKLMESKSKRTSSISLFVILGIREHVIRVKGDIVHMRELEGGNIGLGIAFKDLGSDDARIIADFMTSDEE